MLFKRLCPSCGKIITHKSKTNFNRAKKNSSKCKSCVNRNRWKDPEYREKQISAQKKTKLKKSKEISKKSKQLWKDPKYREKQQNGYDEKCKEKISKSSKKAWQNPKFRKNIIKKNQERMTGEYKQKQIEKQTKTKNTSESKKKYSEISKKAWQNPKYRENIIQKNKKRWQDPEYREKMSKISANQPKVSNIQKILYSILKDLDVKYYREYSDKPNDKECSIGWYNFDCVVPRKGKSTLLIECQGDYWHSLKNVIHNDQSKLSYINNNFPGQYEIKYLWEHEFHNYNKIVELIKYWLGITKYEIIDYDFSNLIIKKSLAKDYRLLLEKYHYLNNAGRGGIAYGAYFNDELISVVVFSPPMRQNIDISKRFLELSRFCIHPRYQKKNLGSWFISRAIKLLKENRPDIEAIISYCDTTFNHNGALYKSLNFKQDRTVRPDYWYVSDDGYVMHKKTLYNHAIKIKMKEREFAKKYDYKKVFGKKKLRFIYYI